MEELLKSISDNYDFLITLVSHNIFCNVHHSFITKKESYLLRECQHIGSKKMQKTKR